MKNKKGFTLIELLAVIVILAIIALIAVPIVINIINKANKSAFKDTAYGIISAGELYFAEQQLDLDGMSGTVEFTFPNDIDGLEIKGNLPEQGSMKITEEGYIALAISNGRYCIIKDVHESDITIYENVEQCFLPGTRVVSGESQLTLSNSGGVNLTNYIIYGNSVQNGTPAPDAPIEIESVGERTSNLLNKNIAYTQSKVIDKNGEIIVWGDRWAVFDYIEVSSNTTYTRSYDSDNHFGSVVFYDENKVEIGYTLSFGVFATPENCKYVRFNLLLESLPTLMLVEGEYTQEEFEELTYEPYGYKIPVKASNGTEEYKTNIYLDEPLRKIGDYADYIDFENGKVVRQIKETVFDGITNKTKSVGLYSTNGLYYGVFSIQNSVNGSHAVSKNTHFKSVTGYPLSNNSYVTGGGAVYVMVHTNQELNTIDLWDAWLKEQYNAGVPVRAYNGLETPIEETIELPNIPTFKGTTIIEVDTEIKPSNMEVTY